MQCLILLFFPFPVTGHLVQWRTVVFKLNVNIFVLMLIEHAAQHALERVFSVLISCSL